VVFRSGNEVWLPPGCTDAFGGRYWLYWFTYWVSWLCVKLVVAPLDEWCQQLNCCFHAFVCSLLQRYLCWRDSLSPGEEGRRGSPSLYHDLGCTGTVSRSWYWWVFPLLIHFCSYLKRPTNLFAMMFAMAQKSDMCASSLLSIDVRWLYLEVCTHLFLIIDIVKLISIVLLLYMYCNAPFSFYLQPNFNCIHNALTLSSFNTT